MNRARLRAAIQDARKRAGLSQDQVADRIGIKQASVSRWENGNLTLQQLERLAETIGTTVGDLLEASGLLGTRSARAAIEADESLAPELRRMVLASYDSAQALQARMPADRLAVEDGNGHGGRPAGQQ